MLSSLKAILGISSLTTPVVFILSGIFLFGAAATWLREDAISDTNAKWELKLSEAKLRAHNEVQERQLLVERLQKQLAQKELEDDERAKKDAEILAKQAVEFPLSAECMRCRVPNERLWVRGTEGMAGKSSPARSKAPGS